MNRRTLIVGLGAALAAGIGATCESGDPHGGGGGPFPPPVTTGAQPTGEQPPAPKEWHGDLSDSHKVIVVSAWVEAAYRPIHVQITATDTVTGEHISLTADENGPGLLFDGVQYEHEVAYNSHNLTRVSIKVSAFKPGSQQGYIATRDGSRYARSAVFAGRQVASLTVDTQR